MYGFHSQRVPHLTRREFQVCELVSAGLDNQAVAYLMGITSNVVKHYLTSIYSKLQMSGRVQLAMYWRCPIFQVGMKELGLRN